ncbi:hypothetical protein [Klebsiella variicola]|uniref:hypothetical protein n=1 Tax=Klebsiella variicola TaxID=244366 RepID=UPI00109B7F84|nr:hypothetical protein [Klebsiella variicola]
MKSAFIYISIAMIFTSCMASAEINPLDVFNASRTDGYEKQDVKETEPEYHQIDIADLKVDQKELVGKKLAVAAYVQHIGDTTFLKNGTLDMNPIFANSDKLPREDRKKLVNSCDTGQCAAIFYGAIKSVPEGTKFFIDKVEWIK